MVHLAERECYIAFLEYICPYTSFMHKVAQGIPAFPSWAWKHMRRIPFLVGWRCCHVRWFVGIAFCVQCGHSPACASRSFTEIWWYNLRSELLSLYNSCLYGLAFGIPLCCNTLVHSLIMGVGFAFCLSIFFLLSSYVSLSCVAVQLLPCVDAQFVSCADDQSLSKFF